MLNTKKIISTIILAGKKTLEVYVKKIIMFHIKMMIHPSRRPTESPIA